VLFASKCRTESGIAASVLIGECCVYPLFLQIEKSKKLKEERRTTQEANVKRKRDAETERRQAKIDRKRAKIDAAAGRGEGAGDDAGDSSDAGEGSDYEGEGAGSGGDRYDIEDDGEYEGEEDVDSDRE
jgi:hypothetical protein